MRIVCVGYRSWSINLYKKLSKELDHEFIIINKTKITPISEIIRYNPDLILFMVGVGKFQKNYQKLPLSNVTPIRSASIEEVVQYKIRL